MRAFGAVQDDAILKIGGPWRKDEVTDGRICTQALPLKELETVEVPG